MKLKKSSPPKKTGGGSSSTHMGTRAVSTRSKFSLKQKYLAQKSLEQKSHDKTFVKNQTSPSSNKDKKNSKDRKISFVSGVSGEKKPFGKSPYSKKPHSRKPFAKKTFSKFSTANQSHGKKTNEKSTFSKEFSKGFSRDSSKSSPGGFSKGIRRGSQRFREAQVEIDNYLRLTKDWDKKRLAEDFLSDFLLSSGDAIDSISQSSPTTSQIANTTDSVGDADTTDADLEKNRQDETLTQPVKTENSPITPEKSSQDNTQIEQITETLSFPINLSRRQTLIRLAAVQVFFSLAQFHGNKLSDLKSADVEFLQGELFLKSNENAPKSEIEGNSLSDLGSGGTTKLSNSDADKKSFASVVYISPMVALGDDHWRHLNKLGKDASDRVLQLAFLAIENLEKIDRLIADNLKRWKISRLDDVVLTVTRLGVAQLIDDGNERPVIINEMVDVAKVYLEPKQVNFVNAILDRIASQHGQN